MERTVANIIPTNYMRLRQGRKSWGGKEGNSLPTFLLGEGT